MDRASLRARLAGPLPSVTAPLREADPAVAAASPLAGAINAAVLVPIIAEGAGAVLLTTRATSLTHHPGQVSFPGGRIDAADASAEAAALREAQEEVGLDPASVELLGRLPTHLTGTGYLVVPVTALIRPEGQTPAPGEVSAIFTLPLATLLDPAAPRRESRLIRGAWRRFWVWPHPEHEIWGATATILVSLARRLRGEEP